MKKARLLVLIKTQIAALTVMIVTATTTPFVLYQQQQSIAQEEEQQFPANQTTFDIKRPASMKSPTDVHGGIVPLSGHWIAEERPDFLVKELIAFFSE
jgi:hypothetical protein